MPTERLDDGDGPRRTCVGCRRRRQQSELTRLHLDDLGRIQVGRTGPGRGAWLCAEDPGRCFGAAVERNGLARAFRRTPDRASIAALGRRWAGGPEPEASSS